MLWYVTNAANTVLFPEISSRNNEDGRLIHKTLKYILAANVIIAIGLVVGGRFFVWALYGEKFLRAYVVFLILLPGLFGDIISRTIGSWLKGTGRPMLLSYVSASSLSVNVVLNCILIPYWGIYGAAFASAISYSCRAIILLFAFCRQTDSSFKSIFVIRRKDMKELTMHIKSILPKCNRIA